VNRLLSPRERRTFLPTAETLLRYSENQPRDEDGRFTDGPESDNLGKDVTTGKSAGNKGRNPQAEREITAVLEASKTASAKAFGSGDIAARDAQEKSDLAKILTKYRVESDPDKFLAQGGEHLVEHSDDPSRVNKFTVDGYGYTLEGTSAPFGSYAELRTASPGEYVERTHLQNEVFGTDNRIEGLSAGMGGISKPSIVTSQSFIHGEAPTGKEVEAEMKSRGFFKVSEDNLVGNHIADKTWYNPEHKIIATDIKNDNFVKTDSGHIVPLDIIVRRADSTALESAMTAGIAKSRGKKLRFDENHDPKTGEFSSGGGTA